MIAPIIQHAADIALAGNCTLHDRCYVACAPDDAGAQAAIKASCDEAFLIRFHAECLGLTALANEYLPEWSQRVFEICEAAAVSAYLGIAALGTNAYYDGQCSNCGSCSACFRQSLPAPFYCYPPPDPCNGNPPCVCYETGGDWVDDEGGGGHCAYSPILINLQSNAATDHLTSAEDGVRFDIAANGVPLRVAWPRKGAYVAFLVLDRNGNGWVDNGSELFGTATRKKDGTRAANGFEALSEFDDNGDGRIDRTDAVFSSLRLWVDLNHDGRSESVELQTLEQAGIVALHTGYSESAREDRHGNRYRYRGTAVVAEDEDDAQEHWRRMFDVFLVTRPE